MNEQKKNVVEVCGYLCWKVNVVGWEERMCVHTQRDASPIGGIL